MTETNKKILPPIIVEEWQSEKEKLKRGARLSVIIFGITILLVVLAGSFPLVLPTFSPGIANVSVKADGTLTTGTVIEILALTAAAATMITTDIRFRNCIVV